MALYDDTPVLGKYWATKRAIGSGSESHASLLWQPVNATGMRMASIMMINGRFIVDGGVDVVYISSTLCNAFLFDLTTVNVMLSFTPECGCEDEQDCENLETADEHEYRQDPFADVGQQFVGASVACDAGSEACVGYS